jgi:hypothetical protein
VNNTSASSGTECSKIQQPFFCKRFGTATTMSSKVSDTKPLLFLAIEIIIFFSAVRRMHKPQGVQGFAVDRSPKLQNVCRREARKTS